MNPKCGNPSGKYFVPILAETEVQPLEKTDASIGIDLGITDFAILSDGLKVDNHKFTSKMEKKLKREQQTCITGEEKWHEPA